MPIDLQAAKLTWEQARDRVNYEHMAWAMLQKSKASLIESYQAAGLSPPAAQREFEKHMEAHSQAYGAALDALSEASDAYSALLKRKKS